MKGAGGGSVQYGIGNASLPANVSKSSSRSPFESPLSPVIVHSTSMEHILDHIFTSLKVGGKSVHHDIVMTECVGNPIYCRNEMVELLFECYGVPRALFGIDSVFSLHANLDDDDGCGTRLVLSIGNCGTHIIPLVDGQLVWSAVRRINWGGAVGADYLLRLLQLKYPSFPQRMTWSQAQEAFINACEFAMDYDATMEAIVNDKGALDAADYVLQFPFIPTDLEALAIKAKEREALAKKRQELADRLREKAKQKKLEKLQVKKEHLEALLELQAKAVTHSEGKLIKKKRTGEEEESSSDIEQEVIEEDEAFDDMLLIHGFDSAEELSKAIDVAKADLKSYENKLAGIEEAKIAPDYSLLDIPDDQLDEAKLQEKRRQRLMKAGADAREKLRLEKEEAARKEAEAQERLEALRVTNFEEWKGELYGQRKRIIQSINERQAKKEALSNRRSMASGARLRTVVSLATAEDEEADQLKRDRKDAIEDDFGAKDEDWQVYRDIRGGNDEDAMEAEEEVLEALNTQLMRIEAILEEHDESFYTILAQEMASSRTILDRIADPNPNNDEASRYQLHLNVERWRATEGLFQPRSLLGLDQCGLSEAVAQVISQFSPSTQAALLSNVFVTGGASQVTGFQERLQAELLQLTPFGSKLNIDYARDFQLDAWKGAAKLVQTQKGSIPWITKEWYEENGQNRLPPFIPNPAYYTNPY